MKLPDIIYKTLKKTGLTKKFEPLPFPEMIDIGLTNYCNLNCAFCVNDQIKKKRGFMEPVLFRSIIDCVKDKFQSKTVLGISLWGEPTLHPNFTEFLKYAFENGVKINLSSNFVEVSEAIARAIIDYRVHAVEISFYNSEKPEYNKIVGREKYDQVLENIRRFLVLAEQAGFQGEIRIRPFKDFSRQVDFYKKEFYEKYPDLNFELRAPKTTRNWAGHLNLPTLLKGVYSRVPCPFPFDRLAVDWDGEVRLCCQAMLAQDLSAGFVIPEHDLAAVWNGPKMQEIRRKFLNIDYRSFPSCRNCYDSRRYIPLRKE